MVIKLILLLCMALCSVNTCYAYLDKDVHLLNDKNGLADNTITAIHKDHNGWMWFATSEGISRYDGREFTNYTLPNIQYGIKEMKEVSPHILMLNKDEELYAFNLMTEKFIDVLTTDNKPVKISGLLPANDSLFYAITGHEFHPIKYSFNEKDSLLICHMLPGYVHHRELAAITYSPQKDIICMADVQGDLVIMDAGNLRIIETISMGDFPGIIINSVYYGDDYIGIATVGYGLILYNLHTKEKSRLTYSHQKSDQQLTHTDVFEVVRINEDNYLAVTWNGYTLIHIDRKTKQIKTEPRNNTSLLLHKNYETRMVSAYYDQSGVLWIGTNGGGIIWSDLSIQFYNSYYQDRHNEICSILQDKNGYIWLATYHKGIMRSKKAFNTSKNLDFTIMGSAEIQKKETALCSIQDEEGNLWFGHLDGTLTFYHMKQQSWKVIALHDANRPINTHSIWALLIDSKGKLWIGTSAGMWVYNREKEKARYLSFNKKTELIDKPLYCRSLVETPDHSIWLGTANYGLCKITDENSIQYGYEDNLANIGNASVRSLLYSKEGNLYIGYMSGLGVLNLAQDRISNFYTTKDGLSNNFIGCLVEGDNGEIWMGSNSSISRWNPKQKIFYNYYISGSNRSAYWADHYLLFGNNRKLTYFNPHDINAFSPNKKVAITGLDINNQQVTVGEKYNGQIILPQSLAYTSKIYLNYENRNFALSFNNLSYSESDQRYSYRLYPYQIDWVNSNSYERVSYVNLPAGEYVFEVKNIIPNSQSNQATQLTISIAPHWSQTGWFQSFMVLLTASFIGFLVYRLKLRQKRLKHELQLENEVFAATVERDKEMQIRMEREKFFTHAAHELRTPLTLILAPVQELLSKVSPSTYIHDRLTVILRNTQLLHNLTDQLLYIQKIEAGMVKLNVSHIDIVPLLKEVISSFESILISRQLTLTQRIPDEHIMLWIDIDKMMAAFRNLISNAIKYTDSKGEIRVSLTQVSIEGVLYCKLSVADTGIGIDEEQQSHIFESFITGQNNPFLSNKMGIGLRIVKNTMDLHHGFVNLKSQPGQGSTFTLLIPFGKEHFNQDYDHINMVTPVKIDTEEPTEELIISAPTQTIEKNSKSLLIIEDNLEVRSYICSLFRDEFMIYEAKDGLEGVDMAQKYKPDSIISDIMMPIKDGFACCKELKENPLTAHIPILMLTAKAEDADILKASKIGADDYMMKPFNPDILVQRIKNLILQRERLKIIYTKSLMLKQISSEENLEGAKSDFIHEIIQIIEANLSNEDFNVKSLAEKLNISQPTLYRKIKQYSDLNAIDMIRSVRMSKAASLIMENRYTLQEIAEKVGYSDVRTLRKHFSEQFGVPPSKFTGNSSFSSEK